MAYLTAFIPWQICSISSSTGEKKKKVAAAFCIQQGHCLGVAIFKLLEQRHWVTATRCVSASKCEFYRALGPQHLLRVPKQNQTLPQKPVPKSPVGKTQICLPATHPLQTPTPDGTQSQNTIWCLIQPQPSACAAHQSISFCSI